MIFFDSHVHYDDPRFDADRDGLLRLLPERGVRLVLDPGSDLPSSERAAALAERWPFLYAAAGVHPHEAKSWDGDSERRLRELLRRPKVRALGEIGLDFHYDLSERSVQADVLRRQLALASELDVPVIIHSREASELTLEILSEFPARGVIHCFSGSAETAKELLRAGWHIGFTGAVTFKNARKPVEAAAVVPLDRLLIETDGPYMAPVPCRGQRCDSTLLPYTAAKLAEVKGVTPEEIARATMENALRVYRITQDEARAIGALPSPEETEE